MKPGDLVLVRFPFADLTTQKKRPALLLQRTEIAPSQWLGTLAMVTSRVDGLAVSGDVTLEHWQDVGLLHPSLVRLAKIATVDGELIEKRIGSLSNADKKRIKAALKKMLQTWWS